ncbi:MAG: hypothetical protein ABEJ69_03610 [Candidatus Nanohaloarchaea archaeon]
MPMEDVQSLAKQCGDVHREGDVIYCEGERQQNDVVCVLRATGSQKQISIAGSGGGYGSQSVDVECIRVDEIADEIEETRNDSSFF